jgi:hypothetical protein
VALCCGAALAAGCATQPEPPAAAENSTAAADSGTAGSCSEPRPQVCTMIYAPVCALHLDGREETHASACNACADETVVSHREGACEAPTS